MNRFSKLIAASLCMLSANFGYAQQQSSNPTPSPRAPKECTPCAPKQYVPKACLPKPCQPCPAVCFERGYPDTKCCIPSAYNEPARYELSPCPWNVWTDASFTYWTAYEEGLDLAQSFSLLNSKLVFSNSTYVTQKTEWKPGFKVGLGVQLGQDNWNAYAEYTWFRSKTNTNSGTAPAGPAGTTDAAWYLNSWGLFQDVYAASSISSKWRLGMDLLDVALSRPYYKGTHLLVTPFAGIRASWIRQNLRMDTTPTGSLDATSKAIFHNKSNSWAIGPRAGFQGKWQLGCNFRLEGDVGSSIAFTQYTTVSSSNDPTSKALLYTYSANYGSHYNTIRFNNDMNLGLGWGSYFDCRNYHFDLFLSYDFQIFWNQNMIRKLVDGSNRGISPSPSNLYLQGLTIRAEFDF